MTRSRSSRSSDPRWRAAALAFALALVVTAVSTGAAAASQADAAVVVTDASVEPGGEAAVRVVLTEAPDGLAGYSLTLTLEGEGADRIAGADYPGAFALTTDPAVGDDGRTVALEAADLEGRIEPGARNVTLATVTVSAGTAGGATLAATDLQVDADGGDRVSPAVEDGRLTVGSATATATATPTEPGTTSAGADGPDTGASGTDGAEPTTSAGGPGFGAVLALAALLGGVLLGARRRRPRT